jgi:hypothetical protein
MVTYLFVLDAERSTNVLDLVNDGLFCGLLDDVGHVNSTLVYTEGQNQLAPEFILKERLQ